MGSGSWTRATYNSYASTTSLASKKTAREVFTARQVTSIWNVKDVMLRESRDSDEHPNSTPIIIGLDVTGSMGSIPHNLIRGGLPDLMDNLLGQSMNNFTVPDPQVMFIGIGDMSCDSTPIQACQFESDIRIVEQLSSLYVELGGGGNQTESYDLAWLFAANYTSTDAWDKRKKKGYLFTIGDELPPVGPHDLSKNWPRLAERMSGIQGQYNPEEMLAKAQERYAVFHLIIEQGNGMRSIGASKVIGGWRELLGNNAVLVSDYTKIADVITSIIAVCEGKDPNDVVQLFEGKDSQPVVKRALFD